MGQVVSMNRQMGHGLTAGHHKTPPVLIVGAGPVGLTMAAELARYGIAVRLIDKAAQPTDKSRAVVVWGATLELLDRVGCADAFVAAGIQAKAAHLIANPSKPGSRLTICGQAIRIDFGLLDNHFPYALMLPQSETERLLTAYLAGLGVSIERSVELLHLRQDGAGDGTGEEVEAVLQHADGRQEIVRHAWLIGCDGAHSSVRKLIGQRFAGHTFPTEWLMADLTLDGLPTPPGEPALFFHADGILALFPIGPDNLYRLAANLGPALEEGLGKDVSLAEIQALISRRGPSTLTATQSTWHATFRINERQVENYRSGRVFLVGDAAHIHSPAGGQGMNTGMQDAENLAWKLALTMRGAVAGDGLLASYDLERRATGLQALRVAGRMTALGLMKHPLSQGLRNRVARLVMRGAIVQRALARQLSGLTVCYRRSPLNGAQSLSRRLSWFSGAARRPGPGERFPLVAHAGQTRGQALGQPRFHLVGRMMATEVEQLSDRFPQLLHPGILTAPGGMTADGLWLLRPDGYVALATTAGNGAAIAAYLATIAAPSATAASELAAVSATG